MNSVIIIIKLSFSLSFKIFPGRLAFLYNGRLHTSRNWLALPFVLALMIIPFGFHWGFEYWSLSIFSISSLSYKYTLFQISAVYLINNVSVALPVIGSFFFVIGVASYLVCAFTDPGFLPRADPFEAYNTEKTNSKITNLLNYLIYSILKTYITVSQKIWLSTCLVYIIQVRRLKLLILMDANMKWSFV